MTNPFIFNLSNTFFGELNSLLSLGECEKTMILMPLVRTWWKDPVFSSAVLTAGILHLIALTLELGMPQDRETSTKEIAGSLRQTDEKIEHADLLAQTDQQGSGKFREAHRMSSDRRSPLLEQKAGEEQQESPDLLQQKQELSFEEKVLMTTLSWQKQAEENQRKKMQEQLQSQFQAKAAMVASLEAQYLQRQQNFSRQQKIKTVDGIQSKQD